MSTPNIPPTVLEAIAEVRFKMESFSPSLRGYFALVDRHREEVLDTIEDVTGRSIWGDRGLLGQGAQVELACFALETLRTSLIQSVRQLEESMIALDGAVKKPDDRPPAPASQRSADDPPSGRVHRPPPADDQASGRDRPDPFTVVAGSKPIRRYRRHDLDRLLIERPAAHGRAI